MTATRLIELLEDFVSVHGNLDMMLPSKPDENGVLQREREEVMGIVRARNQYLSSEGILRSGEAYVCLIEGE